MAWEIEDHLCRRCLGRVLSGYDSKTGSKVYRCSNCGLQDRGHVHNVCCCGVKINGKRDAGLRCVPNQKQDAEFPGEVVAVSTGGA